MDSSLALTADSPFAPLSSTPSADQTLCIGPPPIHHGDIVHEPVVSSAGVAAVELKYQNELVQVRLGLASSLFAPLRARHAATAAHCLRVALGCSSWGPQLMLKEQQRDELEVAA